MTTEYFERLIRESQIDEAKRMTRVRSRIYGYKYTEQGIEIVEHEAEIIRGIIGELVSIDFLSASKILIAIAKDLRSTSPQTRNRSGRLFTSFDLAKLAANPVYAGLELNSIGIFSRVHNYPKIVVNEKDFRKAWSRLKKESLV